MQHESGHTITNIYVEKACKVNSGAEWKSLESNIAFFVELPSFVKSSLVF